MDTLFPDEDAPPQKQAMLLKEPHGYHETAYRNIPSLPNTHPGANPLQKMTRLSPRASRAERQFDLQQRFPTPALKQPQPPALRPELALVIKGKFPSNRHMPTQEVLDLAIHLQLPARSSSSRCLRVPGPSALVFPRIRSAASPSAPPRPRGEKVELPSQSQGSQQRMKLSFTSQGAFLL